MPNTHHIARKKRREAGLHQPLWELYHTQWHKRLLLCLLSEGSYLPPHAVAILGSKPSTPGLLGTSQVWTQQHCFANTCGHLLHPGISYSWHCDLHSWWTMEQRKAYPIHRARGRCSKIREWGHFWYSEWNPLEQKDLHTHTRKLTGSLDKIETCSELTNKLICCAHWEQKADVGASHVKAWFPGSSDHRWGFLESGGLLRALKSWMNQSAMHLQLDGPLGGGRHFRKSITESAPLKVGYVSLLFCPLSGCHGEYLWSNISSLPWLASPKPWGMELSDLQHWYTFCLYIACLKCFITAMEMLLTRNLGAGEMAQRLGALNALPEVLNSIPSNHMVAHHHL